MTRSDHPVAKVVLVPKDSRGPRIISEEPLELQYIQQGVAKSLMAHIERHPLTHGMVNFTDQEINANLALTSSASGYWATIDLSDASDRLSCALFLRVWPKRLHKKFMALRSHETVLPDGRVVHLRKYAPMGSAVCFPVESLVFWALCVGALRKKGLPLDFATRSVYVYGDDLIIPAEHAPDVMNALESVDLKVNRDKSFISGHFRESCGCDAWNGTVITPVRLKKPLGRSPEDGTAHAAWLAYAGRLLDIGCSNTGMYCKELVQGFLGEIPVTSQPMGYLSVVTQRLQPTSPMGYRRVRWNADLQRWEAKCLTLTTEREESKLLGWERLNRSLIDPDPVDPSTVVVRDATKIVRRWCPIGATFGDWVSAGLR